MHDVCIEAFAQAHVCETMFIDVEIVRLKKFK